MDIAGLRMRAARAAAALRLRRSPTASAMRDLAADLSAALWARPHPPADVRELCHALCAEMSARRGGRPVELRFERFPDEIEVTGLWVEFQDFDLVIVEERAEAVQQLVILGHELWHMHAGHGHHHTPGTAAAHALADRPAGRDPGPVPEVAPAVRRLVRTLAAPDESPGTTSTRASARHAESTLPHPRTELRTARAGGTPTTPHGPPSGRTTPLPTQAQALAVAARDGSRERDEAEADDFGHRLAAAFRPLLSGRDGRDTGTPLGPLQRSLGYRGSGRSAR